MEFVCLLTLIVILDKNVHGKTDCIKHSSKGCEYCVQQSPWYSNCRWCELDNKCHAYGSVPPYNPCYENQVIKDVANCPKLDVFGEYDPHSSYNLLRLSTIPYAGNQNEALTCLKSHGIDDYEIVEWIGRHCEDLPLIEYKECLAVVMISHKRKAIVLAYRGTTVFIQLLDIIRSVLVTSKVSAEIGSGAVQKYFKQAHDKLFGCVVASMQFQISNYPDYNIWITGHSLGGAVASIASARLVYEGLIKKEKMALYTFGMPKVGNRQYAIEHNRLVNNSWRVVHRDDPVPHYPLSTGLPNGPYHHRTEVYYPSKIMLPTDTNYVICSGSDNNDCGSSFPLLKPDIENHEIYFDIPVGTYCQSVVGRKRRSINSAMWNYFNNNTCSRIKNPEFSGNDYPTNRVLVCTGNVQTTMLLIFFKCLMFN
ncbi:unnamed protein product [Mytilus coruscus]|uniref:Fungal lipase-type domain-containing protein n=1 Tax=Mytilus coruscus TaxID=42192 RepID=A0A6J8BVZ8_MYTCO|nr:unnamed protein product [Mytilus coruscus]